MISSENGRILLVEDERGVRDLIVMHLKREGIDVTAVESGEIAIDLMKKEHFNLVMLDWMLPGISGLNLCRQIRSNAQDSCLTQKDVPLLMITARADTADVVLGLEYGADDYVTKPFEIPILLARVRALLRRRQSPSQSKAIPAKDLWLDADSHRVVCKGKDVQLTLSEFKILKALVENEGRVLSRVRIIELIQGEEGADATEERAIDTHVVSLRKKLGQCADAIETVRGVGYRIKQHEAS